MRCASAVLCDAAAAAALPRLQLAAMTGSNYISALTAAAAAAAAAAAVVRSTHRYNTSAQSSRPARRSSQQLMCNSAALAEALRCLTCCGCPLQLHTLERFVSDRAFSAVCVNICTCMNTQPLRTWLLSRQLSSCLRGRGRAESSLCNSAAAVHAGKCAYLSVPYGERITPLRLSLPCR
jgi:hypothetical protein